MKKENLFLAFALFFAGNTPTIYAMEFNKAENSETLKASKKNLKEITDKENVLLQDLDTAVNNGIQDGFRNFLRIVNCLCAMSDSIYDAAKEVFKFSPIQDMNNIDTDLEAIKNISSEIKTTVKNTFHATNRDYVKEENRDKITLKFDKIIEKFSENNDLEGLYHSVGSIYDDMTMEDGNQNESVVDFVDKFHDNAVVSIYTQLQEGSKFRTAFKNALDHFAELSNK